MIAGNSQSNNTPTSSYDDANDEDDEDENETDDSNELDDGNGINYIRKNFVKII